MPHGHDFELSKTKLDKILTNYLKLGLIKSNQSNMHVLKIF